MNKSKILITITFLLVFILLQNLGLQAQCAMCKSNLEMARQGGGTNVGNTLNSGILYLLVLPYLVAGVFGFIYYRNYKLKKAKISNS
jgi:hypothetical protein